MDSTSPAVSTAPTADQLEFNASFLKAMDLLENSRQHIFVTGNAGTGKSTLLQYFREHTAKKIVVLAPTGVAAVNIRGQTIHSFFRFKPDITPEGVFSIPLRRGTRKLYEHLDAIVIDEISMVRSDLLDCIDNFLRANGRHKDTPFGGTQMIFFGDLYQLPPVVSREEADIFKTHYPSPYFFDAKAFHYLNPKIIELNKIYRQSEEQFIQLLSAVRNNSLNESEIKLINQRYQPRFLPDKDDFYIYLTTTNALAEKINREELQKLAGNIFSCSGEITGEFDNKSLPTQVSLELKVGAQVMLLNNDSAGRWINGSLGKITYLDEEGYGDGVIEIELSDGRPVEVKRFSWEMFRFYFNEDTECLQSESVGSFTQYPLKLAWAVTIHKAQGKTFSGVVVDIGHGTFSHGQMYVALSRCTRFEGLILRQPLQRRHILLDPRIVDFMKSAVRE